MFLGILITAISYLIYPFFKFKIICKKKYYSIERIRCELIINSVVICIAYLILQQVLTGTISVVNFTPALVYYYINVSLHKNRNKKFNKKINENVEEKKEIESIVELKEENQEIKNNENIINNNKSVIKFDYTNELKLALFAIIVFIIFLLLISIEKQSNKINIAEKNDYNHFSVI